MGSNRLKCFVASAFDHDVIDTLYDNGIKRVLLDKGIAPLCVNRVEHNDDIDDKILELIDECDFCIADLTFARPSVYYEAGRVDGLGKPVIFTSRKDHFKPTQGDDYGDIQGRG